MAATPDLCGTATPDGPCALPPHRRGWHDSDPPTVQIPRNAAGNVQVSHTQLQRYGTMDMTGDDPASISGCPRAYALTYSQGEVPEMPSPAAEMGSVLHRALHRMEQDSCGPEDALQRVWAPTLSMADYSDAVEILLGYLDRDGPMTRYATLATELDITATLFTDPVHGPVIFRGIVDNISIDPMDPEIVRVVDHKSSSRPVSAADLRGHVQLRGYVWLVRQWWREKFGTDPERIVAHLDLLRFRDIPIEYTDYELDVWHQWACAMVRTMLEDRAAMPILNPGCTHCPVRWGCPAWRALPGSGMSVWTRLAGRSVPELIEHYQDATEVMGLLGKQVKQLETTLGAEAHAVGSLTVGDQDWVSGPGSKTVVDVLDLVDLLLPGHPSAFTTAVGSSKAALQRAARGLAPSLRDQVLNCATSVESGLKLTKKQTKGADR